MTKEEGGEEEVVCETGATRKELMWDGMATSTHQLMKVPLENLKLSMLYRIENNLSCFCTI